MLAAASPSFVVFVAGLGVVVEAAVQHGLGSAARDVMPEGAGFWALLAIVAMAALLANVVNNIPATLVLLPVLAVGPTGRLLALLVGVNVGPNLTYTGSLATLLWRRVVRAEDIEPSRTRVLPARRARDSTRARAVDGRALVDAARHRLTVRFERAGGNLRAGDGARRNRPSG